MIIYDDAKNRFEYFEKQNIIVATVTLIGGEVMKKAFNEALDVFRKNQCKKWFADNRNFKAMSFDDQSWFSTVWFPEVLKNGLKYFAVVEKSGISDSDSIKGYAKTLAGIGVDAQVFNDIEEAKKWIISKI